MVLIPFLGTGINVWKTIPPEMNIMGNENPVINSAIPVKVCRCSEGVEMANIANKKQGYKASLKLMGIIPVKNVKVNINNPKKVSLQGTPFGIKIFTDGVMVVGTSAVITEKGAINPAEKAGIEIGDVIISINGKKVTNNKQVATVIEQSKGKELNLTLKRNDKEYCAKLGAVLSADDRLYKAGMWIRDSSAGIGTLTYTDKSNNSFAGLGHGICDVDTGNIIPLSNGEIVPVILTDIKKSYQGAPGELKGFLDEGVIGSLKYNSPMGVYGTLTENNKSGYDYPIAAKYQVKEGAAKVLTTLPGRETKFYDCYIEKVNYDEKNLTRNLIIKITDKELLEHAGGIVQGMSGSPIVQNGKFIGAVTHVFVNTPQLGYGIFAENMVNVSNSVGSENTKQAS